MARRNGHIRSGYQDQDPKDIANWAESQEKDPKKIVEKLRPLVSAIAASLLYLKLRPGKRRVLAVNLLPQSYGLNEKTKADLAKVSERHWHRCKHDDELNAANKYVIEKTVGYVIPEMWGRLIELARRNNLAAIQIILEKAKIIEPAGALVNLNVGNRTDDELAGIVYQNLEITPAKATGNRDGSRRIAQA